jgi:transmembrane 9 superfamily protein 2/4
MLITLLGFAFVRFIVPSERESLKSLMVVIFALLSIISGYVSSRLLKMFNNKDWLKNALYTAFWYPCIAFCIFITINIFLLLEGSSTAVSFKSLFILFLLWLLVSSPLVLIGAFIGTITKSVKNPGNVNVVPSSIPPQPFYLQYVYILALSGVLPFW